MTSTVETIDIPADTILALVDTICLSHTTQSENIAFTRELLGALRTRGDNAPDTFRTTVEAAHRLYHQSDAMTAYGLDECAEETYRHPGVIAEIALLRQLTDEAPAEFERLDAEHDARVDAELAHLARLESAGF